MNYQVTNDAASPWQYKNGYVNIYIKEVFLYKYVILFRCFFQSFWKDYTVPLAPEHSRLFISCSIASSEKSEHFILIS